MQGIHPYMAQLLAQARIADLQRAARPRVHDGRRWARASRARARAGHRDQPAGRARGEAGECPGVRPAARSGSARRYGPAESLGVRDGGGFGAACRAKLAEDV